MNKLEFIKGIYPIIKEQIERLNKKFYYSYFLFENETGLDVIKQGRQEHISEHPSVFGGVFSVYNGKYFVEYSFSNIDKENIVSIVDKILSDVPIFNMKHRVPEEVLGEKHFKTEQKIPLDSIKLEDKIAKIRSQNDYIAGKDERIKNVINVYKENFIFKAFISANNFLTQDITRLDRVIQIIVSDGKSVKYNYDGISKQGGYEHVDIPEEIIEKTVKDAMKLLSANKIESGFYDIVASPEVAGLIAHEAFGHGMEMDMFLKERAMGASYIGKQIASPLVTMYDSALEPGESGSFYFDDEGMPATKTKIIDKGILVKGMTDLNAAMRLNAERTSNGRRESYKRKSYARMTNTFFAPGESGKDEMIASVDNGIYLIKGGSGMEDPKNWGIQIECLIGEEIKNGALTGKIYSPIFITGYVPDLLKSISMVGNDLEISGLGYCGKGHKEWVKVSSGGPHIKFKTRLG